MTLIISFRYENPDLRIKTAKQPRQKITLFGVLAMVCVLLFLLYIFFDDKVEIKTNALKQENNNLTILESIELTKRNRFFISNENVEDSTLESTEETYIGNGSMHNLINFHSKRIKRLDNKSGENIEAQKLVILPSRSLLPPKVGKRPRIRNPRRNTTNLIQKKVNTPPSVQISNHNMNPSRVSVDTPIAGRRQFTKNAITVNPRPFGFQIIDPMPSGFKKSQITTPNSFPLNVQETQLHSIQDILNYEMKNNDSTPKEKMMNKIEFAGTYRHPGKNDITRLFVANLPTVTPTTQIQPQPYVTPAYIQNFIPDPFHNFRPSAPTDVNLLAMNQVRFAPMPNYRVVKAKVVKPTVMAYNNEIENMYQKIIRANNQRLRQQQINFLKRNSQQTQKPFSLMLDVYPMPNDDEDTAPTTRPIPIRIQKPPLSAFTNPDNSYYNAMNFHQMKQQRHPLAAGYYNNMMYKNFNQYQPQQSYHHNHNHHQEVAEESMHEPKKKAPSKAANKPSQLVVHLNLYPKNKKNEKNRTSQESDINKRSSREGDDDILVEMKNNTKPVTEVFGRKIKKSKKPSESGSKMSKSMSAGFQVVSGSNEQPYTIGFNINSHSDEKPEDIAIKKGDRLNITHSLDPPSKNYLYEDEDTPIIVSPSLPYSTITRKNRNNNHINYGFIATTESPTEANYYSEEKRDPEIEINPNDYIHFEHKDARNRFNF